VLQHDIGEATVAARFGGEEFRMILRLCELAPLRRESLAHTLTGGARHDRELNESILRLICDRKHAFAWVEPGSRAPFRAEPTRPPEYAR
jgi:hypothetical protein